MTQLASPASERDTLLDVDDLSEVALDDVLLLDEELVVVRGRPRQGSRVLVGRGYLGTERAAHSAGATLEAYDATAPGGSGLPSQWTTDEFGNLMIAATPAAFQDENGFAGLILQSTDDDNTFDMFMVKAVGGGAGFAIDPFGYASAQGLDLSSPVDTTVLKVDGSNNTVHDVFQARDAGGQKIRLTWDGRLLLSDLPTSDPGIAGQVYVDGVPSAGTPRTLKISGG